MMASSRKISGKKDVSGTVVADGPKVVLVDSRALSRSCTLVGLSGGMDLMATAVASLEDVPSDVVPDIVLLQNFRVRGAISALSQLLTEIRTRWPGCPTVIVTEENDTSDLLESLRSGAEGLLNNTVGMETLIDSLRLVSKGFIVYPRDTLQIVSNAMATMDGSGWPKTSVNDHVLNWDRFKNLTVRQNDVLRYLAQGMSNKAIGLQLKISESTVKVHIRSIMERAGVSNRIQIIAHLISSGAAGNLARLNGSVETMGDLQEAETL
ncbi:MAG: response regulator transcription factor [Sphingomonadales bacterium]|nr:response regulator transcription factor [Sphingomonadales bacterium]